MSEQTANIGLPYILPSQAQKHVTHNEALRMLDAVVQLAVLDRDLAAPPASPDAGARYIIAASPTGAWTGHAGSVAAWQDGAWNFYPPEIGWRCWIADENELLVFDGSAWVKAQRTQGLALFGINTTADSSNRLAVRSTASLFDHVGFGHQHKINKATSADTASLLFQTGYSGRAEIGTAGDDNLHLKVSADGTAWNEAMVVQRSTGMPSFPKGIRHDASGLPLVQLLPCSPVPEIWRIDAARPATPRTFAIASISSALLNLSANAAQIFGASMAGVCMVRVWNTSKSPAQSAWVLGVNSATQLVVSNAAHIAGWSNGETLRLGDPNPTGSNVLEMVAIDISPYMQTHLGAVFAQKGVLLATYASATGGSASVDGSGNGAAGSVAGTAAMSDGTRNFGMVTLFTTVLSPVSGSNLVFVREPLGAASAMSICYMRLQGVFV